MITNLLFDFSRVILFPKDEKYSGLLNDLYRKIVSENAAFLDHYRFNNELLEFLKTLKNKFKLSIYTTDIVQNDPESKKIVDELKDGFDSYWLFAPWDKQYSYLIFLLKAGMDQPAAYSVEITHDFRGWEVKRLGSL